MAAAWEPLFAVYRVVVIYVATVAISCPTEEDDNDPRRVVSAHDVHDASDPPGPTNSSDAIASESSLSRRYAPKRRREALSFKFAPRAAKGPGP